MRLVRTHTILVLVALSGCAVDPYRTSPPGTPPGRPARRVGRARRYPVPPLPVPAEPSDRRAAADARSQGASARCGRNSRARQPVARESGAGAAKARRPAGRYGLAGARAAHRAQQSVALDRDGPAAHGSAEFRPGRVDGPQGAFDVHRRQPYPIGGLATGRRRPEARGKNPESQEAWNARKHWPCDQALP